MLPFVANSTGEEGIGEKRIGVAMRMIGHEVLLCLGDSESRILPIEKLDGQYKISFESEFGFDPDDIVSTIDRVMTENSIASDYLVEVQQCETNEVVYSFEIRRYAVNPDLIPCEGRPLPTDCYSLWVTLFEDAGPIASLSASSLTAPADEKANPFKPVLLILSLLIMVGFTGFFLWKKNNADQNPNLILVGASQFDQKNMSLSFENNSVELSHKEAELLYLLCSSANTPVAREVILQNVWGDEGDYVGRTLDVYISKLRKKLEADASVKIVNIRGIGYKLVMDVPG